MFDKIKKTSKNTAIYGIGNILNKSLGLLLIPFVQKYIPIAEYGWLTLIELSILALSSTIVLGITNGHERFFYTEKDNGSYGVFLFSNSFFLFFVSIVVLSIVALFSQPLSMLVFKSYEYQFAIILSLIITFFEINNIIPFQILQYEEKATQYIVANSTRLLISLLATIVFVAYFKLGILGVLYGRLLGSGGFAIYQLVSTILPRITLQFSFFKVKQTILYGFPMIISSIGYILFSMSDRFMLSHYSTAEQTGKYAFGFKIANLVMIIVQSIGVGYLPSFYLQEKSENNARYYRKMLTYYTFSMSYLVLIFLFFYKPLLKPIISNQDYWEGLEIVPILSLGFLLMGMNYFVNAGIVLKNKTSYLLIPTFVAATINIILIYLFIPLFGFWGPAISTLLSQVIYVSILASISKKFVDIRFEWGKVTLSLLLAVGFFFVGFYVAYYSALLSLLSKFVLLTIYPYVLYKLNFFELIELEKLALLKVKVKKMMHF